MSRFDVVFADSAAGLDAWLDAWSRWSTREVFAHPSYVSLNLPPGHRAAAALFTDDRGSILYPFVLRDLSVEKWWPGGDRAFDISSAYGYGGPFVWSGSTDLPSLTAFWNMFSDWASCSAVVAEFVRFGLYGVARDGYPGETEYKLDNVVRDLAVPSDVMWMEFDHKVRKNVQKAQRNGLRVARDVVAGLSAFVEIYEHTMRRRAAHTSYFFQREYFEELQRALPEQHAFFHVLQDERVISSELVLVSEENVYSFLGGTRAEAFDLRPNDLLKFEIIKWAQALGKRRFILGGGNAPDDGIIRYKLSFAPAGRVPFYVGRRIIRPELYAALTRSRGSVAPSRPGFFPAYRA